MLLAPRPDGDGDDWLDHPTAVHESLSLAGARGALRRAAASYCPAPGGIVARRAPHLSPMQLHTVRFAMAGLLGRRGGFALGDGTGTGKGRVIAALVHEWLARHPRGRVLWLTANRRLGGAAASELALLAEQSGRGADEATTTPSAWLHAHAHAFRFASYSSLRFVKHWNDLVAWLRADVENDPPPPLVVLDECHLLRRRQHLFRRCEELCGSTARILFSSATMMSEADHLHYLAYRFGLVRLDEEAYADAPFATAREMTLALRRGGRTLLEAVALHLAHEGLYASRALATAHVPVVVHRVGIDTGAYDVLVEACRACRQTGGAAVQAVCMQTVVALKARHAIAVAHAELARGRAVIVSVVHTSAAADMRRRRQTTPSGDDGVGRDAGPPTPIAADHFAQVATRLGLSEATTQAALLERRLPWDALDQLVDAFGAARVAEITGRTVRRVRDRDSGGWRWEQVRAAQEVDAFCSGAKRIALLSRAGGLGLSLHDTVGDAPRTHILLELPWASDDLVQLLGRCHRAGTASTPEYHLITADVPAEERVTHTLSRRVQCMGALTRADRASFDALRLGAIFGRGTTTQDRRTFAARLAMRVLCRTPVACDPERLARGVRMWLVADDAAARSMRERLRGLARVLLRADDVPGRRPLARQRIAQNALVLLCRVHAALRRAAEEADADGPPEIDLDELPWTWDTAWVAHAVDDWIPHAPSSAAPSTGERALDAEDGAMVVLALTAAFPGAFARDVLGEWTPSRTRAYGPRDRARVRTVACAAAHPSARATLGRLPTALVEKVLESALQSPTALLDAAAGAWCRHDLERLPACTHENLCNAAMLMTRREQHATATLFVESAADPFEGIVDDGFVSAAPTSTAPDAALEASVDDDASDGGIGDDGSVDVPRGSTTSIVAWATARLMSATARQMLRARFVDTRAVCTDHADVVHLYDVRLAYELHPRPSPPAEAHFYRHRRSATLCWTHGVGAIDEATGRRRAAAHTAATTWDGDAVDLAAADEDEYVRIPRHVFVHMDERRRSHAQEAVRHLPDTVRVATRGVLHAWQTSSTRCLVRFPAPPSSAAAAPLLTGLVVATRKADGAPSP